MPFVTVAKVGELAEGAGKSAAVGGRKVAVFFSGGRYFAIDDTCPHRGAPLSEGYCEGNEVTCPWHATRFDLTTGAALCPPARSGVKSYPVQVVGDEVQADVS